MTDDELVAGLMRIQREVGGDREAWHSRADDLVLLALREAGLERGAKLYGEQQAEWWYA